MTTGGLRRRTVLKQVGAGVAGTTPAGTAVAGDGGPLREQLASMRAATTRFQDPSLSEDRSEILADDGTTLFERGNLVVEGMGEHYTNAGFGWDLDPPPPAILSYGYTPREDLVLGAVEFFAGFLDDPHDPDVPDLFRDGRPAGEGLHSEHAAWGVDTLTYPPEALDYGGDGVISNDDLETHIHGSDEDDDHDHEGGGVAAWVLHVWVHGANPGGVFDQLNSRREFHRCPGSYDPTCMPTTIVRPQLDPDDPERVVASEGGCSG